MNTTFSNNSKTKAMRNFFFWSAGADVKVLEKCPTEQIKYTAIGVMMLFISLLSCVSFTIFLTISFEFNPFLALIGGVIWACLIFCLERVVLTSFRKGETSVITIVLRFVLVLSTAFVIGEPLVLSFYAKEIKLEMISQNRSIVTNARQEITARYQEEVSNLESSNNNIQARLDLLKKDRDDKQNAITEEVEGKSRTGRSGYGIAAKQKEDAFNDANAKYNEYKTESVEILKQNNARLSEIRKEIEDQTKITAETAKGADGILARQEALSSLIRNKSGVATFYFACLAILILLETIPLIFKVFGKKNGYEIALDGEEAKEIVFIQQDKKICGRKSHSLA